MNICYYIEESDTKQLEKNLHEFCVKRACELLELPEDDVRLIHNAKGKPMFQNHPELHVSISHTRGAGIVTFSSEEIGVDVEYARKSIPKTRIHQEFPKDEDDYIFQDESPEECRQRFLSIWTRKEAYTKFLGTGLSHGTYCFSTLSPKPGIYYDTVEWKGKIISLCGNKPVKIQIEEVRQVKEAF